MIRRLEQADELFSRGMSSLVISMTMLAHAAILKVKGTAEATLDSTLLTKLTEKQYKMVRDMKAGSSAFDTTMFVERLFTFMGGRANVSLEAARDDEFNAEIDDDDDPTVPLLWGKIGQLALSKSRRVPTTTFMYGFNSPDSVHHTETSWFRLGPLSIEAKKRTITKRSKLEKNKEDLRKPQQITEEDITRSENETTKNVAAVRIAVFG